MLLEREGDLAQIGAARCTESVSTDDIDRVARESFEQTLASRIAFVRRDPPIQECRGELVVPGDSTAERKLEVAETLVARLEAHPRVTRAGFADLPPFTGWRSTSV